MASETGPVGYLKKRRAEIPRLLLQALCAVGSLAVSLRVRFRTRNCSTSGSVRSPTENAVPSRANMPIEIAPAVAKLEQRGERHVKAIGVSDVNGPAEIAKLSRFSVIPPIAELRRSHSAQKERPVLGPP